MARIARTALLLSLLGFALGLGAQRMPAISAAEPPIVWNTDLKLRTALDQPTGLTWGGLPLRRGLLSLSRTKQVAIVLDRHVDPEQKVELSSRRRASSRQHIISGIAQLRENRRQLARSAACFTLGPKRRRKNPHAFTGSRRK